MHRTHQGQTGNLEERLAGERRQKEYGRVRFEKALSCPSGEYLKGLKVYESGRKMQLLCSSKCEDPITPSSAFFHYEPTLIKGYEGHDRTWGGVMVLYSVMKDFGL